MNEKGEVKDSRIVHTIIKSDRRFTYEEAQKVIETGEGDYKEEILELNKLAQILRKQRLAAGAIDFDRIEVKFEIDETGKPLSVYFKESKEANKLIEEFMLLANRTVAERIGKVPKNKKAKVFPYRIHDLPDPDKLENLNWFINRFGYKIRTSGSKTEISKSINRLLDDIKNKKEQNLVETVSLRAMQKARYSTENIGTMAWLSNTIHISPLLSAVIRIRWCIACLLSTQMAAEVQTRNITKNSVSIALKWNRLHRMQNVTVSNIRW